MKYFFLLIQFLFIGISLMFFGCGGNDVLLQPTYSNEEIARNKISNANIKVSKVIDHRTTEANTIGTARVGMFNKKVPYHIAVPLNDFIKNVYDSLLLVTPQTSFIPVIVYIDTFIVEEQNSLFSEVGVCQAKLNFGIPSSQDSLIFFTTRALETVSSGIDVTDLMEPLVYKSIVACGKQFVDKVHTMDIKFITSSADSAFVFSSKIQSSLPAQTIEVAGQKSKAIGYSDIGFSYMSGGKIENGFRFFYNTLAQKDSSHSLVGFGYNFEILKVMNEESMIQGTMATFGGNFVFRQLLSEEKTSAYLGLQGTLTFGSESIDYGTHKENSFYFGPLIRETVGLSVNKKVYLEAGLYEILLLGSKMLPSDAGFTMGISFDI